MPSPMSAPTISPNRITPTAPLAARAALPGSVARAALPGLPAHAARPLGSALPPLGRGRHADGLSATSRRVVVSGVVAAHVVGAWALLQVSAVREAVLVAAPMFVSLIALPAPPAPTVPPVPMPPPAPQPVRTLQLAPPLIAAAPGPAPAAFVVPAAPLQAVEAPAPPVPVMVVAAPAPPAPVPPSRRIPASAVQYLEPPVLVYPRLSERNGERGRVMVRVFIDTLGLPQNVQVSQSSGFSRLDDAAVSAVRKARFKPYTENGQPAAGWAVVPADFE